MKGLIVVASVVALACFFINSIFNSEGPWIYTLPDEVESIHITYILDEKYEEGHTANDQATFWYWNTTNNHPDVDISIIPDFTWALRDEYTRGLYYATVTVGSPVPLNSIASITFELGKDEALE